MFSANDRIKFLEKEIVVFREESLKLYDKLEKTSTELEYYRKKYEEAVAQLQASQTTVRESIKVTKNLEKGKSAYSLKIEELERKLEMKDKEI